MIKVNLLPVKKKKKSKPVPAFLIATIVLTLVTGGISFYVNYFFASKIKVRKTQVQENENKIRDLQSKIQAVNDFEKRNADFKQRKDIIEQLTRNKTLPVKIIDEIANVLPAGVWLSAMSINGADLSMTCTGFSNTDVVNFINNLKNSKMLYEVYLLESVQSSMAGYSVYNFRVICKVRV